MRKKYFEFSKWFHKQFGPGPKRDAFAVEADLNNARTHVRKLEAELREVHHYQDSFTAALYARNATESFYDKKKRKGKK